MHRYVSDKNYMCTLCAKLQQYAYLTGESHEGFWYRSDLNLSGIRGVEYPCMRGRGPLPQRIILVQGEVKYPCIQGKGSLPWTIKEIR